jgi:hypothetical protein
MVAGVFQSAAVSAFRTGYTGEGVKFRLRVEFSYRIGDLEHPGVYVHDFGTEEDALGLARVWRRVLYMSGMTQFRHLGM